MRCLATVAHIYRLLGRFSFTTFMQRLFLLLLLLVPLGMQAQKNVTLSGYIKDEGTGEDLIGATVVLTEAEAGANTNEYGFFSITVPPGTYTVQVSYMGYQTLSQQVQLQEDQRLTLNLKSDVALTTETVVVKGEATHVGDVKMSSNTLDIVQAKNLPALFGEVDVLKTLQLMPGIQTAGDGNAGFFVRGGGADQNLILLDEATVYNASHLLGFFSVFNSDAIKDLEIQKGGIPAKYGGRLSSVVDIRMKDGSNKHFRATGGIGTISSRLTLEAPLKKDKGSIMLSGRRTYADMFLALSSDPGLKNNKLYFYDLNLKANYQLGEKDRVYLSGYFGRDVFKNAGAFGLGWGNGTGTLRWNHLYSSRLFSNITLIYSDFKYGFDFSLDPKQSAEYDSRVQDWQLKLDYTYVHSPKSKIYFGGTGIYHKFTPGVFTPVGESSFFNKLELSKKYAVESAVYVDHEWKPTNRWAFRYGLRASHFVQLGPGNVRSYQADGRTPVDTTTYDAGTGIKGYLNLEPRLGIRYLLNDQSSLKASYNRTAQYMHLVSNSSSPLPTDLWIPSSYHVVPEQADQVALGYFRDLKGGKIEFSAEVYYKWMYNLLDYRDNADLFFNEYLETEFLSGKGRSYGLELFLRKTSGNFTGWVSYTLARTERQVVGINNNEWYSATNDRRHNLSLVGSYELNKKWILSATWTFLTGNAATFPEGRYSLMGFWVPAYGQTGGVTQRNAARYPSYHRLDISATYKFKKKNPESNWQHSLNFSVYNAYGRKNAWSISFTENEDTGKPEIRKTYLFTYIPSVTWNFEFK